MTARSDKDRTAGEKRLTIAYLFEKHPSLSQTFLKREIQELMRQGFRVEIHSLWRSKPTARRSGRNKGGRDSIELLDHAPTRTEANSSEFAGFDQLPVRYFRWWESIRLLTSLPREWRQDPALLPDGWRVVRQYGTAGLGNFIVNVWAAVFAVCRASEFRQRRPNLIHAVWGTGPATAAAILSRRCGIPYSVGTDGYDVHERGGDPYLEPKLRAARFVQANFQANAEHLRQRVPSACVILARRGLERLPPVVHRCRTAGPWRILSVGRLVPKKGHCHQLAACALLKQWGVPFEARIIGRGHLHGRLQRQLRSLGLADVVTLCGGQPHEQVQAAYEWADIFWHTGVVDNIGNRDGLPNVIPEALAHRLPVISGPVPGATEAVTHEVTGLVVDVANSAALAGAVKRLTEDEPLRKRLGENGRRWVEENFLASRNVAILAAAFRGAVDDPVREGGERDDA